LPITREAIGASTGNPAAPEPGIRAAALRDLARRPGRRAFILME
jgi:hypothetical protein